MTSTTTISTPETIVCHHANTRERLSMMKRINKSLKELNETLEQLYHQSLRDEATQLEMGVVCVSVSSTGCQEEYNESIEEFAFSQRDEEKIKYYDFIYSDPANSEMTPVKVYVAVRDANFKDRTSCDDCHEVVASNEPFDEFDECKDVVGNLDSEGIAEFRKIVRICLEAANIEE